MRLCDFHIHSKFSDGELGLREIVDLYGRASFGAIAITDHLCDDKSFLGLSAKYLKLSLLESNFDEYLEQIRTEAQRAKSLYNMLVIPGVEFTFNSFKYAKSAHILALGITKFIDPNTDLLTILANIRAQGAISVAAHPVPTRRSEAQTYYLWQHKEELSQHIDLWEAASGSFLFDEVLCSNLPIIANSDLHKRRHFSSWKTLLPTVDNFIDVKKNLLDQNFKIQYFYESKEAICSEQKWNKLNIPTANLGKLSLDLR